MSNRRNDFDLPTDQERFAKKLQSAYLSLDRLKEYANSMALLYERAKHKIAGSESKMRDLCRRNVRLIQASPNTRLILVFYFCVLIAVYFYDVFVTGPELRSLINHWLTPVVVVGIALAIALGLVYSAEDEYESILDTSHLGDKDPRIVWRSLAWSRYKTACIAKGLYLVAMIGASLYATAQIYIASDMSLGAATGGGDSYGITDGDIPEEYRDYMLGQEEAALSARFGIVMPFVFALVSVLGHGWLMLSGRRVFTALGYVGFKLSYNSLALILYKHRSTRDKALMAIGQAFSSYKRQLMMIHAMNPAFLDEADPFSGLAERAYKEYTDGVRDDDPDILGEFLNGAKESRPMSDINVPPPPDVPEVDIDAAFDDEEARPGLNTWFQSLFSGNHKRAGAGQ